MAPPSPPPPCVLTIAGSDSSGGAGVQADLKTFFARGVYGASVITALTAQNTLGVQGVHTPPASFLSLQLTSVLSDLPVAAAKTGMLPTAAAVTAVAAALPAALPLVVDPVLISTSGAPLSDGATLRALRDELLPRSALATPNVPEASALLGWDAGRDARRACAELGAFCGGAVLLKGGHGGGDAAVDVLWDGGYEAYARPWVQTRCTHGTGCTLAAAAAAEIAKGGSVREAVAVAKEFVWGGLENAWPIGGGHGPVNHLWEAQRGAGRGVGKGV